MNPAEAEKQSLDMRHRDRIDQAKQASTVPLPDAMTDNFRDITDSDFEWVLDLLRDLRPKPEWMEIRGRTE